MTVDEIETVIRRGMCPEHRLAEKPCDTCARKLAVIAAVHELHGRVERAEAAYNLVTASLEGGCGNPLVQAIVRAEKAELALAEAMRRSKWLPDYAPLTENDLRAIRLRWSTAPEGYQADADAMMAGLLDARRECAAMLEAIHGPTDTRLGTCPSCGRPVIDTPTRKVWCPVCTAEGAIRDADTLRAERDSPKERGRVLREAADILVAKEQRTAALLVRGLAAEIESGKE